MKPASAIGFLAGFNIVQNRFFNRRGYVAANLTATALGLIWARREGFTLDELGIHPDDGLRGSLAGMGAGVSALAIGMASRDLEVLKGLLDDDRLEDVEDRDVWFRLLVRFPLGTALFEEVWFRGVLPASLRRSGVRRPDLVSSAVFAAWHLIPTAVAVRANPSGSNLSATRRAGLVVGGSVAAGLGGLALARMRRGTASLAAPWLAHAAFNGIAFWSAMQRRRSGA